MDLSGYDGKRPLQEWRPDLPWQDWGTAAGAGQNVLADDRSGKRLRLNALHYDDQGTCRVNNKMTATYSTSADVSGDLCQFWYLTASALVQELLQQTPEVLSPINSKSFLYVVTIQKLQACLISYTASWKNADRSSIKTPANDFQSMLYFHKNAQIKR